MSGGVFLCPSQKVLHGAINPTYDVDVRNSGEHPSRYSESGRTTNDASDTPFPPKSGWAIRHHFEG